MDRLRECVALLLDESRPIENQLEIIAPKGKPPFIGGFGRALITPILMCVHPVGAKLSGGLHRCLLSALPSSFLIMQQNAAKKCAAYGTGCPNGIADQWAVVRPPGTDKDRPHG